MFPPSPEVVEQGKQAALYGLLPAFAAAAGVFALILAAFGRRAGFAAAGLALAAGWAVGNHFRGAAPWLPGDKRIDWLAPAALAGTVAGLLTRLPRLPAGWGWALWAAVLALAAVRVLPKDAPWWAAPAFVLLTTAVGFGLADLSRRCPGAAVPASLGVSLFAAGTVAVHAPYLTAADTATLAGAALFGIAAVALFFKADAGGALPGAAVLLTGVAVLAYDYRNTDGKVVPWGSFALAAAAPTAAVVLLLPPLRRKGGTWPGLIAFALVAAAAATAVGIAATYAPYEVSKDEW